MNATYFKKPKFKIGEVVVINDPPKIKQGVIIAANHDKEWLYNIEIVEDYSDKSVRMNVSEDILEAID